MGGELLRTRAGFLSGLHPIQSSSPLLPSIQSLFQPQRSEDRAKKRIAEPCSWSSSLPHYISLPSPSMPRQSLLNVFSLAPSPPPTSPVSRANHCQRRGMPSASSRFLHVSSFQGRGYKVSFCCCWWCCVRSTKESVGFLVRCMSDRTEYCCVVLCRDGKKSYICNPGKQPRTGRVVVIVDKQT